MLKRAFPNGIPSQDYFTLLFILGELMSLRNVASIIPFIDPNKGYYSVYNDVLGAKSDLTPSPESVIDLKQRLIEYGYDEWLNELDL